MSSDPLKELGMHGGASPNIFHKAKILRNNLTQAELHLWNYLKNKPYNYKFRRQHPFGKYILDFYCHQKRLSIEIDGISHNSKEQKEYDVIRTSFIEELAVKELRFSNKEVLEDFEKVKGIIEDKLQ